MTIEAKQPERILCLETGQNFRDLGGYSTSSGRRVRWRRVFRSGVMARISGADAQLLRGLGIVTICDFRTSGERERRPTIWHSAEETSLWAHEHEMSTGAVMETIGRPDVTVADMHAMMCEVYRGLPYEQSISIRELFTRIANGRLPLVFNCAAGKDRTGVAAALLLHSLGVSRTIIEEDYLLTNDFLPNLIPHLEKEPGYGDFVRTQPELAMPLLRAEPDYLDTMFKTIEMRHGSVEGFLREAVGLSTADLAAVRAELVQ